MWTKESPLPKPGQSKWWWVRSTKLQPTTCEIAWGGYEGDLVLAYVPGHKEPLIDGLGKLGSDCGVEWFGPCEVPL